ncbi:FHA domain-containing protein [Candidatus Poribacteria bacterium]|nr:FHA domain-containing protein [Candidatus Poribacteria bacterium]
MKIAVVKGAEEGTVFRLHDGVNSVGRDVTSRVRLLDPRVSRKHCKIRKVGQSLFLSDLGTKNGTSVNGASVTEQELKLGDQIKVGSTILRVVGEDYVSEKIARLPRPVSSLRRFFTAIRREKAEAEVEEGEFRKFKRRRFRPIWRPSVDTDPPEGRQETVMSRTDPDS